MLPLSSSDVMIEIHQRGVTGVVAAQIRAGFRVATCLENINPTQGFVLQPRDVVSFLENASAWFDGAAGGLNDFAFVSDEPRNRIALLHIHAGEIGAS